MDSYLFETIEYSKKYPAKIFAASIDKSSYHWHYEYELITVLEGSIWVNTSPEPVTLQTGDIIFLNSKAVHEIRSTGEENLCLFIQMNQSMFRDINDANRTYYFYLNSKSKKLLPKKSFIEYVKLAAQIGISSAREEVEGYFRTKALLYTLVADMFETVPYDTHQSAKDKKEREEYVLLESILQYIQNNHHSDTVLDDLYKQMGLTEKTTYRLLKNSIGISAKDLVMKCRIDSAKALLKFSEKPIGYITNACGFGCENSFYRIFKKEVGVTPVEYRKMGAYVDTNKEIQGYINFNLLNTNQLLHSFSKGEIGK